MPQVVYRLQDHEPIRDEEETYVSCPDCEGDNRILFREEGTRYSMVNEPCETCNGAGSVPTSVRVRRVREKRARATPTPVSGVRVKGGG